MHISRQFIQSFFTSTVWWLGVALSCILFLLTTQMLESKARAQFDYQAKNAQLAIQTRVSSYVDVLRGVSALFYADNQLTREQFRAYVKQLNLEQNFPGIGNLNFAPRIFAHQLSAFKSSVQHDVSLDQGGYPEFSITPPGERAEYHVLTYQEPAERNLGTFGFDIASSEPVAKTLDEARDSGRLSASGRLIRITGAYRRVGLAMRMPLYRRGMPLDTVEQRRAAYYGSVGAGFDVNKLLLGAVDQETLRYVRLKMYDTGRNDEQRAAAIVDPERLIFSSDEVAEERHKVFSPTNSANLLIKRAAMAVGPRIWEIEFAASEAAMLSGIDTYLPWLVLGAGLLVSLFLYCAYYFMQAHQQALSRMANADALTTLPNRHWLMNFLPTALARARLDSQTLAILFVDLDDFKNINDTLGHPAGDALLQAAAMRLRAVIRPSDNVVRLGGDEFTVIVEQAADASDASLVAERIVSALSEPFLLADGRSHTVHGSVGISIFPQDGEDADTLLKHADIAMYAAKANGKAHYQFFQTHLSENLVARLNTEHALRKAIENDEFVLHYQPRVDTFNGELRSVEALVRWMHPERGLVQPLEFIALAEDTGLILKLGELVIEKACAQLAQWQVQNLPVVPISVNVSPHQFNHGNISTLFASWMAHYGIDHSLIEIEITESCMMGEDNAVTEKLADLEALGIKLLVDDFGTGYSSLSQLQRLNLDALKVDRAFTAQLCTGKEGEAFFMAILSMAHVLGISVVAEGVETAAQLRILQALSCNEIQGSLISGPVTANEMPALMLRRFLFPAPVAGIGTELAQA